MGLARKGKRVSLTLSKPRCCTFTHASIVNSNVTNTSTPKVINLNSCKPSNVFGVFVQTEIRLRRHAKVKSFWGTRRLYHSEMEIEFQINQSETRESPIWASSGRDQIGEQSLLVSVVSCGSSANKSATIPNDSRPRKLCFRASMADEMAAALVTETGTNGQWLLTLGGGCGYYGSVRVFIVLPDQLRIAFSSAFQLVVIKLIFKNKTHWDENEEGCREERIGRPCLPITKILLSGHNDTPAATSQLKVSLVSDSPRIRPSEGRHESRVEYVFPRKEEHVRDLIRHAASTSPSSPACFRGRKISRFLEE